MQEGLLWFDNDPQRKMADKIKQAAKRYQSRLHCKPTVCYLNSEEFDTSLNQVDGIHLKPARNIRPHYFWIGVEQDAVKTAA
jgi:hypothetical protein